MATHNTASQSFTLPPASTTLAVSAGAAAGLQVVYSGSATNSFTLTLKDSSGYDVLEGLGVVPPGGLVLYADDIGGNPVRGTSLTMGINGGDSGASVTVRLMYQV